MARRLISTAVMVMKWSKLDPDHRAQPTESQVRDALARVTKDLDDMLVAKGQGWEVESIDGKDSFGFSMHDSGEALDLRGTMVIVRPD